MFKARCLLVLCSLILLANAAPLEKDSEAKILTNEYQIDAKGNYKFVFGTSQLMSREETGTIVNEGQPNEYISVKGRYAFINAEGKFQVIEYTSGINGFNVLPSKPIGMSNYALPYSAVATLLGK